MSSASPDAAREGQRADPRPSLGSGSHRCQLAGVISQSGVSGTGLPDSSGCGQARAVVQLPCVHGGDCDVGGDSWLDLQRKSEKLLAFEIIHV